jgi:signal transduction histidine kinase
VTQVLDLSAEIFASLKPLRGILAPEIRIVERIPDGPFLIRADRAGLTQVLTKLVLNAARAMGNRGTVAVSLGSGILNVPAAKALDIGRGPYALLSVADTGCGIPQDVLPRLFEPFFAAEPIGPRRPSGLSVAHGIVRGWDGAIAVQTTPGLGTIVTIHLPLLESEQVVLKRAS